MFVVNRDHEIIKEDIHSHHPLHPGVSTRLHLHHHSEPLGYQTTVACFHNLIGSRCRHKSIRPTEYSEQSAGLHDALLGEAAPHGIPHLTSFITLALLFLTLNPTISGTSAQLLAVL